MDTTLNLEARIALPPKDLPEKSFTITPPLEPNKPFLADTIYISPDYVIVMGFHTLTPTQSTRGTYRFSSDQLLRAIDHAGVEAVGMPLPWIDKITAHIRFLRRTEQLFHYEED